MKLTKNFNLEEFEQSSTADKYKINNSIPQHLMPYVLQLAEQLQLIRDTWQSQITINSGYRCDKLNAKVGGAKNSDHKFACAADITVGSRDKNKQLFTTILSMVKQGKLHLRQIIDESNYKWLHLSVNNEYNGYRDNQILHL